MSSEQEAHNAPPEFGFDDIQTENEDAVFVSVVSPTDVSLSGADDDEDNPFGEPTTREKTPTNTTNTVESYAVSEKIVPQQTRTTENVETDKKDPFETEKASDFSSVLDDTPFVPVAASAPIKVETSSHSMRSTTPFETQKSSSSAATTSIFTEIKNDTTPVRKHAAEYNIEIVVSDPTKVGEGMSSYMTYRITTKTTLPIFKKSEFSVNRRFSDFLGLHTKLVNKHLSSGIILPSPPEKDSISMAKVKIAKDDDLPSDFIDRRRSFLERYLNRLVRHPKLVEDSDVRDFIEITHDLPKATNTQALSGAGVLRAISTISKTVTKFATKTSEQDQWFEEKHQFTVDLHATLKRLYSSLSLIFSQREEAGHALKSFSVSLNHLATIEEHPLLSSALIELANLKEKLEQIHNEQGQKEYSLLTELVKEYISLLEMVQLSFQERIKVHQHWLSCEETLRKKREAKAKLEQSPKGADKIPQAEQEIHDWEGKVVHGKESFEHISENIKKELEVFDGIRIDEFIKAVDDYLHDLLDVNNKILQLWEDYLPEANKISL